MAVDKSFVVKNGLEVNSDLIVADATGKKVGIASTAPRFTLDVRGGIAATDITIDDTATIATLNVSSAGDVNLTNLKVTGFSTLGGLSVDQLTVTGFTTFTDLSYDEINGRNLILTGIATIPQLDGITVFTDLNGTNATVGVATITTANVTTANVTTLAGFPNFSSGATVSGVVTASQFVGAGQIGIGTSGGLVGYGVSFLDFRGPGFTTAQFNSAVGIVTLNFQGGGGSGSASIGVGSTPGDAFTGIITAGNLWYNTGLGRLFIYYQDDNSAQWVDAAPFNVGIITQLTSVAFSTGSVAAPSLSFGNDTNTGFFAPADGSLSFASNAVGIVTFNSTGVLATTYFGDGSNLTGIDATSLKDSGGNVKAQANPAGVVITGVATATTFSGALSGNATSATTATTATNAQGLTGSPSISVADVTASQLNVSGVSTFGGASNFNNTINVADDIVANFGAGSDGRIFFENSENEFHVRVPGGSGKLTLGAGAPVQITNEDGNTNRAVFTSNGATITGIATATAFKVGAAISITDGAISATRFHGDGSNLTGIDATTLTDSGGDIKIQANPNGIVITGIATATDFDSTSDVRLKTNIHVVDGALDKVNRLRGVSFDWKESGKSSYGVIAQELEVVLPELVHGDDPKRVNYNGIIGVLIESIKELSARVDELENK
jgi:hypothetical protein